MKKLLAALLLSTPLAVALPAAAKFQVYGAFTPASETSDEDKDKKSPDEEKKDFQVSDEEKDKKSPDEEKKDLLISDGDKEKDQGDGEKKDLLA